MTMKSGEVAFDDPGCRRRGAIRPLVLVAMCLAVLIAQIDTSVVNLATHAIGDSFQAGVTALRWVLDGQFAAYTRK